MNKEEEEILHGLTPAEISPKSLNALLLSDCKEDNDSLRRVNAKLQQDIRSLTARVAEFETQIAEAKNRQPVQPPAEERKPSTTLPAAEPLTVLPAIDIGATYEAGLSLFHQRDYQNALAKFESVAADVGSGLMDHGTYWSAECQFALKNYNEALALFKKVLGFSQPDKKDDAQMMIGNCYLALGNSSQAKTEFQKLIKKYPASPYVKRAKEKLKQL